MNRFERIYVHVGLDKTGSTVLQTTLTENAQTLLEHGFYYALPVYSWHHAYLASCFSEAPEQYIFNIQAGRTDPQTLRNEDRDYLEQFKAFAAASSAHTMLLSYEGFAGLDRATHERMADFLAELSDRVEIIAYCRPPLSYALSGSSQMLAMGVLPGATLPVSPWRDIFEPLVSVYGRDNVTVRPYTRTGTGGASIIDDYCASVGVPAEAVATFRMVQDVAGQALTDAGREVARTLIGQVQARLDGRGEPPYTATEFHQAWAGPLVAIPGERATLTAEVAEQTLAAARPHLDYLRDRFGLTFEPEAQLIGTGASVVSEQEVTDRASRLLIEAAESRASILIRPQASLLCSRAPSTVQSGGSAMLDLTVRNESDQPMISDIFHRLWLRCQWFDADGRRVEASTSRHRLQPIASRGVRVMTVAAVAPPHAGQYELRVSLEQDGAPPFDDQGRHSARVTMKIIDPIDIVGPMNPDLAARYQDLKEVRWLHSIQLSADVAIEGVKPAALIAQERAAILEPLDLRGRSVLDIGAWNGYFSFEAKRLGAERVIASDSFCWTDPRFRGRETFELARECLDLDIEAVEIDPTELPGDLEPVDVVLMLGVFYHLYDPMPVMRAAADLARDVFVIETHQDLHLAGKPAMAFYPRDTLGGDRTNWWGPNAECVLELLATVGFEHVTYQHHPVVGYGRGIFHAFRSPEVAQEYLRETDLVLLDMDTESSRTNSVAWVRALDASQIPPPPAPEPEPEPAAEPEPEPVSLIQEEVPPQPQRPKPRPTVRRRFRNKLAARLPKKLRRKIRRRLRAARKRRRQRQAGQGKLPSAK